MPPTNEETAPSEHSVPPSHRVLHSSQRVISVQRDSPIALSPDGTRLAYAGENRNVRVLKRADPTSEFGEYATLVGMTDTVMVLTFYPPAASSSASSSSAGGERICAGGVNGIFIWELSAGRMQPIMTIPSGRAPGHDAQVECLCWIAGATTLVSGSKDATFKMWDAVDGRFTLLETNDDHKASVLCLAYSERASLLATTGRDSSIKVWDASTLHIKMRTKRADDSSVRIGLKLNLEGHRGDVTAIGFAESAQVLFSGARDNTVKIWELVGGSQVRSLAAHKADVRFLQTISADKVLVTGSLDGTVKFWELAPIETKRLTNESDIDKILNAQPTALVEEALAETDVLLNTLEAHSSGVYAVQLSPAQPLCMLTAARLNEVRVWSLEDTSAPREIQEVAGHSGPVTAVRLCNDDAWLATISTDFHLYLFSTADGGLIGKVNCGAGMFALTTTPDSDLVVAGGNDFVIKVIPIKEGAPNRFQLAMNLVGHAGKVNCVSCAPESGLVASVSQDFTLRIWPLPIESGRGRVTGTTANPESVEPLAQIQPHKGVPLVVVWSRAHRGMLATCSNDHDIATWTFSGAPKPKREWHVPSAHTKLVSALCFGVNSSAHLLFSGSWDDSIKVWNFRAGSQVPLKTLTGHTGRISELSVSADGRLLTSSSADGTLRVWDTQDPFECQCECAEDGPRRIVTTLDAGNSVAVSGSDDGCVRIWPFSAVL